MKTLGTLRGPYKHSEQISKSRETPNCVLRLSRLGIEALDYRQQNEPAKHAGKLASDCPGDGEDAASLQVFEL